MTATTTPSLAARQSEAEGAALAVINGYILCGLEPVSVEVTMDKGDTAQFTYDLSPPLPADFGVAVLTGFALEYKDGDHHVKTIEVMLDPLPQKTPPTSLSGSMLLRDDGKDKKWTGKVYADVLYFTPYWT